MSTPPSQVDWTWLLSQDIESIAAAAGEYQRAQWIKDFYAWLYPRLDASAKFNLLPPKQATPQGPRGRWCPLLLVGPDQKGILGFVSVELSGQILARSPNLDFLAQQDAQSVADTVCAHFRNLSYQSYWPSIQIQRPLDTIVEGSSLSLSTLIATLASILGLDVPDDVVATGTWNKERHCFCGVEEFTVASKLNAARKWGYRRVLVIGDQPGIPEDWKSKTDRLPAPIGDAILALAKSLWPDAIDEELAVMLGMFDQLTVRNLPLSCTADHVLRETEQYTDPQMPALVRHLAHDIRSRALLHAGQTNAAELERVRAKNSGSFPMPRHSWLKQYLQYHQPAHHSVVALDQGIFDRNHELHERNDLAIEHLKEEMKRWGKDKERLLASEYLHNTRARGLLYRGRWEQDIKWIEKAFEDLLIHRSDWDTLAEYSHKLGLRDGDLRRQHNQVIDALLEIWEFHGKELPGEYASVAGDLWPAQMSGELGGNPFDWAAFVRWHVLMNRSCDLLIVEQILTHVSSLQDKNPGSRFPAMVCETILRYGVGEARIQQIAATQVCRSGLFASDAPNLYRLLAVRARRLVEAARMESPPLRLSDEGTILHDMAVELLSDSPQRAIRRCMY